MTNGSASLISVVMPCFNAAGHIAASLESALAQSYRNLELVVVDDGSTDDTLAELERFHSLDRRVTVATQPNSGPGAARNHGLRVARGDYIAFLDADDAWHPQCLEKLAAALDRNPDAGLAYCGWQNVGLSGGRGDPYIPPDYEQENKLEVVFSSCPWPIHAALTRRDAVTAVGGFDEQWTSCMDFELWLKIAVQNRIVLVPEVLAFYHHHEGEQITKNRARIAINHWAIQMKYVRDHPDFAEQLGAGKIRELSYGKLLKRGYESYWKRDLEAARRIFRLVMRSGYGSLKDWKYMLPSLFPLRLHRALVGLLGSR